MATTTSYTVDKNSWKPIGSGTGSFLVQSQGPSPVKINVSNSLPSADAPGVVLGAAEKNISIADTNGTIYAKLADGGTAAQKVVVIWGGAI